MENFNEVQNDFENDLTLKSLVDALSQKPTITEKLNYWLEIKDNFKDFYPQRFNSLSIPESIYKMHFEMYENDAEFTFWLLKYNANSCFDTIKRVKNIDKKLDSLLAKDHIEAELKEIYEFEERAKESLKAKKFDIYEFHYNSQYQDEIEYLRITDNYYEKQGQRNPLSIGENLKPLMAYVTHVLLKNLLETKLKELEPESPTNEKPATEQKGFDLGLTEEQLKALHKELIEKKFLDKNTKLNHFINAFNGEVLKDFERLEWLKSVCGAIFIKVNFDTDSKNLKVWQNAEKIFNNGKAVSLRNADKGIDKHKDYFKKLSEIIKSLP